MLNKVCPWGLIAICLAALGLLLAFFLNLWIPPLVLAGLGLLVAMVGPLATYHPDSPQKNLVWPILGGTLNCAVLAMILFAPGLVNRHWAKDGSVALDASVVASDPDKLMLVRDSSLEEKIPMSATDWADAATEFIRQDEMYIRVKSAQIGRLPEKSATPVVMVHLIANQLWVSRTITFAGFGKGLPEPVLTDEAGRSYRFLGHRKRRFSEAFDLVPMKADQWLIFALPPEVVPGAATLKLEIPTSAWGRKGVCRFRIRHLEPEVKLDMVKEIARVEKMVRDPKEPPADPSLGRVLFARNCFECHTLFGVGSKIGPDLTPYKRHDLKLLLTSIINPSAEIAKGYETWAITTTSGQFYVGIIKQLDADPLVVQTAGKLLRIPREEIEQKLPSKISIMPNDVLKGMGPHEIRSLIAYLSGKSQVRLLATPAIVAAFFNGHDFSNWQPTPATWKVVRGELGGEIIAPNPQAGKPATLTSEMVVEGDFQFTLRFRSGENVRGAILIGGEETTAAKQRVARVEIPGGGAVVVRTSDGRTTPVAGAATDNSIPKNAWSKLEILVTGQRLQVRLNGKNVAEITDDNLPARRLLTLEGPPAVDQELRFANLDLQVFPAKE